MAEIGYTLTSKLIEVLASHTIQKICSKGKCASQLEQLKKTVSRIRKLFLDADGCWEKLNEQDREFIAELKDLVYDAEDVFDKFRTRAELNELGKKSKSKARKLFEKVRDILPFDKSHDHAYRLSRDVMNIMKRLEDIARDHNNFNLQLDNKPLLTRSIETCSYVDAQKIIGRDEDKEEIISVLLDSAFQNSFCFLSIVGMGGLGKTALAQLIFNDENIQAEFPDSTYRLWVCVSDEFDEKLILYKILELISKEEIYINSSKEVIQRKFRQKIGGKKYMLVLDDVWNEERDKWCSLEDFLRMGCEGSKIIVTTRSEKTASLIDNNHVYRLHGLSSQDSQLLFEMSAFREGENNNELLEIGKKIVKKCHRNPLAIKVVGSFLFGQNIIKWQSIERSTLDDIDKVSSDKILPILKLSYYNLTPSLKSCFSYCAIFPKDIRMYKEKLMGLWMAQGYIVPLNGGQNVQDAAEEHFMTLLRRCFFQDIRKDTYGNIESVKIHDLMHDIAQEVGKREICVVNSNASIGEQIRHVNIIYNEISNIFLNNRKIRSYVCRDKEEYMRNNYLDKLTTLRVLDLSYLNIKNLPRTIDRLLLLRYIDLTGNGALEVLPDSIATLYNLQVLKLRFCFSLWKVPYDFSNFINLRHLDLFGCHELNEMPLGILKLTNLRILPFYVVNDKISSEEFIVLQQVFKNLKGRINIRSVGDSRFLVAAKWKHLVNDVIDEGEWIISEDVLEKLEIPPYLNETIIPLQGISLHPNLLHIKITHCSNLEQIPVLSKLSHLNSLELFGLDSVEFMEIGMSSTSHDTKAVEFFPFLGSLNIQNMKKLKGWWKVEFPGIILRCLRLTHLVIKECPNMTSFPSLETSNLCKLDIQCCPKLNIVAPPNLELPSELGELREVLIDKLDYLKLFPHTNNCLTSLGEIDVESGWDYIQSCASSIHTLIFFKCKKMRRLTELDHFTLETLVSECNYKLSVSEKESLISFPQSLRHLVFYELPKMESLPKGMQLVTSLQSLRLEWCVNIKELPEWMSCLSSLQSLYICKASNHFQKQLRNSHS